MKFGRLLILLSSVYFSVNAWAGAGCTTEDLKFADEALARYEAQVKSGNIAPFTMALFMLRYMDIQLCAKKLDQKTYCVKVKTLLKEYETGAENRRPLQNTIKEDEEIMKVRALIGWYCS